MFQLFFSHPMHTLAWNHGTNNYYSLVCTYNYYNLCLPTCEALAPSTEGLAVFVPMSSYILMHIHQPVCMPESFPNNPWPNHHGSKSVMQSCGYTHVSRAQVSLITLIPEITLTLSVKFCIELIMHIHLQIYIIVCIAAWVAHKN